MLRPGIDPHAPPCEANALQLSHCSGTWQSYFASTSHGFRGWRKLLDAIYSSDMAIIQTFSDQSDRCCWNHHCNDAISSHTLTLVAYVWRSEFTEFEAFLVNQNVLDTYIFFWLTFGRVRGCTIKWTLGHRRKKRKWGGGLTPHLPLHYLLLFIPTLTRKLHFLDNIRRI